MHALASPALAVHINSFHPMKDTQWEKVSAANDVLVTFHAVDIGAALVSADHTMRRPVRQLCAAVRARAQQRGHAALTNVFFFFARRGQVAARCDAPGLDAA